MTEKEQNTIKVKHTLKPHKSHKMTGWKSTIVTLVSTPRFGYLRSCKNCEGEHGVTVSGERMHDELYRKCECAK